MNDPNRGTTTFILEYIHRIDPGFAILIKAPWGAGKTHLTKAIINEFEGKAKPLYVSLFGATSREDIEQAIWIASLPMLDKPWAKSVGRLGAFALKNIPLKMEGIKAKDFLNLKLPSTLIFDDLERCSMEPKEILGAINGFVEHEQKNVILLAHEDKFWNKDSLSEKEKVIGRTLTVVADIDSALESLMSGLEDPAKSFLVEMKDTIVEVFNAAGFQNLRSLKQPCGNLNGFSKP